MGYNVNRLKCSTENFKIRIIWNYFELICPFFPSLFYFIVFSGIPPKSKNNNMVFITNSYSTDPYIPRQVYIIYRLDLLSTHRLLYCKINLIKFLPSDFLYDSAWWLRIMITNIIKVYLYDPTAFINVVVGFITINKTI